MNEFRLEWGNNVSNVLCLHGTQMRFWNPTQFVRGSCKTILRHFVYLFDITKFLHILDSILLQLLQRIRTGFV